MDRPVTDLSRQQTPETRSMQEERAVARPRPRPGNRTWLAVAAIAVVAIAVGAAVLGNGSRLSPPGPSAIVPTQGRPATVPPASAGPPVVSFIAFGDAGENTPEQRSLRDLMEQRASEYQLGIMVGDGAYPNGMYEEYVDKFFGVYGGLFQGLGQPLPAPTTGLPKPLYATPGNHDYYGTPDAAGYRASFAGLPQNGPWGQKDYSFTIGNVHFVSLDSQYLTDPETLPKDKEDAKAWLIGDLDRYRDQVTVVFDHHPAYTAGPHADTPEVAEVREEWFAIAAAHGADLFLSGHEHSYERNVPERGLTSYVTGGGGAELSTVQPRSFTAASLSDWEFLEVRVQGCTISTGAVTIHGTIFDPWSFRAASCTGAPAPPPASPRPSHTVLADDFETGIGPSWAVRKAITGSASLAPAPPDASRDHAPADGGHRALELTSTMAAGSIVTARAQLARNPLPNLTVAADMVVLGQGAARTNVPLLKLYDASGNRILSFYRQNGESGRLYVEHGGTFEATTGRVALGAWFRADVRATTSRGQREVEIRLNGILVYDGKWAGAIGAQVLQLGTETPGQAYAEAIGDLRVTVP